MQRSSRVDYDAIAELYDSTPNREKSVDPSCPPISKLRLPPSSTTTTTTDTTKASTISPPQTSTAGAARLSWPNDKGSNDRPLPTVACTACRRPNSTTSMRQSLP